MKRFFIASFALASLVTLAAGCPFWGGPEPEPTDDGLYIWRSDGIPDGTLLHANVSNERIFGFSFSNSSTEDAILTMVGFASPAENDIPLTVAETYKLYDDSGTLLDTFVYPDPPEASIMVFLHPDYAVTQGTVKDFWLMADFGDVSATGTFQAHMLDARATNAEGEPRTVLNLQNFLPLPPSNPIPSALFRF